MAMMLRTAQSAQGAFLRESRRGTFAVLDASKYEKDGDGSGGGDSGGEVQDATCSCQS